MESEYDFSKGERGKFYKKEIKLNLPIYLEPEILSFVESIAEKRNLDVSTVVNNLIKTDYNHIQNKSGPYIFTQ